MAFVPKPYAVYVTITPTKANGIKETMFARVGMAKDVADAKSIIARDKKEMGETYGGMIEAPGVKGRSYQIFKANWQEVAVATA